MSYADGQYPTCQHETHVTRDVLERWWLSVGGKPAHALPQPITSGRGSKAIALQIEDLCDADD